ncbi:unnamed protein product [Allacma fusca]|uniref:Uncharacterized protein n=1 Tax=Allacma fusca TaxID=39272 RepID=A0A8J2J1Y8_9HEXA|nr:unnamed protein product [Allacma fusca]
MLAQDVLQDNDQDESPAMFSHPELAPGPDYQQVEDADEEDDDDEEEEFDKRGQIYPRRKTTGKSEKQPGVQDSFVPIPSSSSSTHSDLNNPVKDFVVLAHRMASLQLFFTLFYGTHYDEKSIFEDFFVSPKTISGESQEQKS